MSETVQGNIEMEKTRERKAVVIGRLRDLGLGNPDGIPSSLAEASEDELQQVAERDNERLVEPNDLSCTNCIDGRTCKCNADGSEPRIRLRRVGGSASNLGVALNAEASITETLNSDSALGDDIAIIDKVVGYRSAHLGGCGGANGEIADNRAIHEKPNVMNAVKALLSIPEVTEYLQLDAIKQSLGDEAFGALFETVRDNAGKTADFLESKGWDGQKYVDGVAVEYPENVADLEVDDDKYHGHKEPKLTIIIGDMTMPLEDDGFTWNLKATKEVAEKLSGQSGARGYALATIADVAKHISVADRLPSDKTPVILQVT